MEEIIKGSTMELGILRAGSCGSNGNRRVPSKLEPCSTIDTKVEFKSEGKRSSAHVLNTRLLCSIVMSSDRRSIVEWGEDEVQQWLTRLGYPQYEAQIKGSFISNLLLFNSFHGRA